VSHKKKKRKNKRKKSQTPNKLRNRRKNALENQDVTTSSFWNSNNSTVFIRRKNPTTLFILILKERSYSKLNQVNNIKQAIRGEVINIFYTLPKHKRNPIEKHVKTFHNNVCYQKVK